MKVGQLSVIEMSVHDFIRIADNPRQRDTERHAKRAKLKHLAAYSPTHDSVAIAAIKGKPLCKLDGHTRAYLWERELLERPKRLLVSCYAVLSLDEAAELYTHFDNQQAVELSGDRIHGACRECNLVLSSGLLKNGDFGTALKTAHFLRSGGFSASESEYELIRKWRNAISELDSFGLSKRKFKGSGLVALAMVAIASRSFAEETLLSFFKGFDEDSGKKEGKLRDGIQALTEHMSDRRLHSQMAGAENIYGMMSKGYSCLKAWSDGVMIQNVQPSIEALTKLHAKAIANINEGMFEFGGE